MRTKNKLVYGIGVNDASYMVTEYEVVIDGLGNTKRKRVWTCPFYDSWSGMLERCYSSKYKLARPSYIGVESCEEWHVFSVFRAWMEKQDWAGKQLDKDLLFPGNNRYTPTACAFITSQLNVFITDSGASRGAYKIGVSWNKKSKKFQSTCSNPFTKKNEHQGYFHTEDAAHQAWRTKKLEHAQKLGALTTDKRVTKSLVERYSNNT